MANSLSNGQITVLLSYDRLRRQHPSLWKLHVRQLLCLMTGFQSNVTTKGLMDPGFVWSLVHVMKKESQRVVPDFSPNPTILSAQTIGGHFPLFFTHPQHKHAFVILYQGASHPLNICQMQMPSFFILSKLMKIFKHPSLPFLEEQGSQLIPQR